MKTAGLVLLLTAVACMVPIGKETVRCNRIQNNNNNYDNNKQETNTKTCTIYHLTKWPLRPFQEENPERMKYSTQNVIPGGFPRGLRCFNTVF